MDWREFPSYVVQKALSTEFWCMKRVLPRSAFGLCAVCLTKGLSGVLYFPPAHHHLVIPRNYTRDKEKTVNWWWNIVPVHEGCHTEAHTMRDQLILELARRISTDYLKEAENVATGLLWLQEQIALEDLKVAVRLPPVNGA
jgi:hypothetical protein